MSQRTSGLSGIDRSRNSRRRTAGDALQVALRVALCVVVVLPTLPGCTPNFWRRQADLDAYALEAATVTDPRFAVPRLDVTPHPESRFADPHDPDCQPLPPDDIAAHEYMHCVDGWKGSPYWHQRGVAPVIENPMWRAPAGLMADGFDPQTGQYVGDGAIPELSLPEAVELSLLHNRDYQFQLEQVYLQALSVSFEEFRLGVRYLGFGGPPGFGVERRFLPGRDRNDSRTIEGNFGISQLLPSGGQLIAEIANDTLYLFGAGGGAIGTSTVSFALTQPLLAGAGRKVNLERLTQAQRDLLYAVRDLARFRRVFFTDVVATGAGQGYLGLLEQIQGIRNQADNIRRLERQVEIERALNSQPRSRLEASLEALPEEATIPDELDRLSYDQERRELTWRGPISPEDIRQIESLSDDPDFLQAVSEIAAQAQGTATPLDVLLLESDLAESIVRLRSSERALQDSLDAYKLLLGLPTDFPLGIDDELLEPFQFIAVELVELEQELILFVDRYADIDDDDPNIERSREVIGELRELKDRVDEQIVELVREDLEATAEGMEARIAELQTDRDRARIRDQVDRDRQLFGDVEGLLDRIDEGLDELLQILDRAEQLDEKADQTESTDEKVALQNQSLTIRKTVRPAIDDARIAITQAIQGLSVVQIGVRSDFVSVQPMRLSIEEATELALNNRLDLMNSRAIVTDAWRAVEINKNQLRSALSIVADGNLRSEPGQNRPLDFNRRASDFRLGVQFDTPLDKLDERNQYRASQITYQRARRDYIEFEDTVKQQVRGSWRQLEVLRRNLETAKQQTRIAALQLDVAIREANEPAQRQSRSGGSSGVRGQNLTRALSDILSAQNTLIGIYTDYERNRLLLYRDMGLMQIGEDGVWEDPFYRRLAAADPGDTDDVAERTEDSLFGDDLDETTARLPLPTLEELERELDGQELDGQELDGQELDGQELDGQNPEADAEDAEGMGFGPGGVAPGELDPLIAPEDAPDGSPDGDPSDTPNIDPNDRIPGTPLPPPAPVLPVGTEVRWETQTRLHGLEPIDAFPRADLSPRAGDVNPRTGEVDSLAKRSFAAETQPRFRREPTPPQPHDVHGPGIDAPGPWGASAAPHAASGTTATTSTIAAAVTTTAQNIGTGRSVDAYDGRSGFFGTHAYPVGKRPGTAAVPFGSAPLPTDFPPPLDLTPPGVLRAAPAPPAHAADRPVRPADIRLADFAEDEPGPSGGSSRDGAADERRLEADGLFGQPADPLRGYLRTLGRIEWLGRVR